MKLSVATSLTRHPYFRHLRLGFNLLLSPVYLWGVLLAGGNLRSLEFWLGFVSLHVFLYGGTTAFNSFYDRDEGPVGGMLRPPAVDAGLLRFSLLFQAIGLIPAALVGGTFLLFWLALFAVFSAYSHPLVRFKARPSSALLAIGLGQGALGFALGWLAARAADFEPGVGAVTASAVGAGAPLSGLLSATALIGAASTALIVVGLYLVTQCYQEEEDRARGDRTVAVLVGASRSLLLALLPMALGGSVLVTWAWLNLAPGWALTLAGFFLILAALQIVWARQFDARSVTQNFRSAMRFTALASGGLTLFLVMQLLRA